jgi:reactive intermediate/imine deaminase
MDKRFINPDGMANSPSYSQAVAVPSGQTLYVSGQVPLNAQGEVVGQGDLEAQTRQVFENIRLVLGAAGASFSDVVKATYYVKNFHPSMLPAIRAVRAQYFTGANPPGSTLVGVQSLFHEDVLIEIEAIAVVPS